MYTYEYFHFEVDWFAKECSKILNFMLLLMNTKYEIYNLQFDNWKNDHKKPWKSGAALHVLKFSKVFFLLWRSVQHELVLHQCLERLNTVPPDIQTQSHTPLILA